MRRGLDIRDAVETIADTLPICSERKTAFSTFTIIRLEDNAHADIIQYENPNVILIRNGVQYEFPLSTMKIGEKTIYRSSLELADGDMFIALSDGMLYASDNGVLNSSWDRDAIAKFMEPLSESGLTSNVLANLLMEETNKLYGGKPFDDATTCIVKIRQRQTVNIAIGPPENISDNHRMMALFFRKKRASTSYAEERPRRSPRNICTQRCRRNIPRQTRIYRRYRMFRALILSPRAL